MYAQIKSTLALAMVLIVTCSYAQDGTDVLELSLEDLMGIEITSVSKKSERLQDVPSSIYVVTGDDLMKSGATTLHEVLRNVPGYWGVQDEYSSVEAAVRNSRTGNNINGTVLFMLDGTPMQDLMSSNFNFRNFDLPLDEIDRIEIIRGSGGTIYGANSATGVISIFTKNPGEYDGVNVRAEGATPGYMMVSGRAGGQIGNNLSLSGYGKIRNFSGFESFAGKDINGESLGITSRFTEDYEKSSMISTGLKGAWNNGGSTRISFNTHFNTLQTTDYTATYENDAFDLLTQTIQTDRLFENDVTDNRFVGNIRLDQDFSENHKLFVRLSANGEKAFNRLGGGFQTTNRFYDFEVQDNFNLAFNEFSIGINYRIVQFDISDINSNTTVNFIDPQANESLRGAFIQDRISVLNDKLKFTFGVKTENFSLVNDIAYFSPMAKVAFLPTSNFTIWGGFTQSFTTPGFNNTNVELFLFQTPPVETWTQAATLGVYQNFYPTYYDIAIAEGNTPEDAAVIADQRTNQFLTTPFAQDIISGVVDDLLLENPNYAVKNGSETVPTKYQAYEIGFRLGLGNSVSLESNAFFNVITDGITTQSFNEFAEYEESVTQPGRFAIYYLYGNYVKGTSVGTESMVRWRPVQNLRLELSHTWLRSEWEFQENDDFNIHDRGAISEEQLDQTPETPYVPEHIFRLGANWSLPNDFNVNINFLQTSKFRSEARYRFDDERYQNLISSSFEASPSTMVGENDTRTILNLRLEKSFSNNRFTAHIFGNDLLNEGIIERTNQVYNVTLSQIGRMYGAGLSYRLSN